MLIERLLFAVAVCFIKGKRYVKRKIFKYEKKDTFNTLVYKFEYYAAD